MTTSAPSIQELALLRAENQALQAENQALQSRNQAMQTAVDDLSSKITSLQETVRHLQRLLFGRKSERVVADGLQPLLPMEGLEPAAPEADASPGEHVEAHERRRAAHHKAGWNEFPPELPREELVLDVPEAERAGLAKVGEERAERLMYRGGYYVQVVVRPVYGAPEAPRAGLVCAPPPAVPVCMAPNADRCHYDISVVVHVIAAKVVDHLPFHRQEQMFLRMGVRFGRAAMCGYFAAASEALEPLFAVLFAKVKACPVLHGDESPVDVLDPGSGKTATGWLWALRTGVGPPMTAFEFSMDRSGQTALRILADFFGTLIRDGYAAYGQLPATAAGCWAHVRRKFFEAQENHPALAAEAIALIRKLYAHERDAKEAAMRRRTETALVKERRKVRRLSAPVADAFFALCRRIGAEQPPASSIARAAGYAADREAELRRFLADARLDIDNNPCENVIRPFCLGRKNWLFVGGRDGGRRMAILASFAATCKENGVDFEKWLLDVLVRLDHTTPKQLPSLLPHLWKTAQTQA